MNKKNTLFRRLGFFIYTIGLIVGIGFGCLSVWADLEASMFSVAITADKKLTTMSCPVIMTTRDGEATVTASIHNPTDKDRIVTVNTAIAERYVSLIREDKSRLELAPRERQVLTWTVTPEDATWKRVVLARVTSGRTPPIPSRSAACGILVLNTSLFGGQFITFAMLALFLLGMVGGGSLWYTQANLNKKKEHNQFIAMCLITGCVAVGIAFSLYGAWLVGGLFLIVAFLVILSAAGWALNWQS